MLVHGGDVLMVGPRLDHRVGERWRKFLTVLETAENKLVEYEYIYAIGSESYDQ